jgi:cysteine sulfinate desulfinase/cysteine desulfurase-like protein
MERTDKNATGGKQEQHVGIEYKLGAAAMNAALDAVVTSREMQAQVARQVRMMCVEHAQERIGPPPGVRSPHKIASWCR